MGHVDASTANNTGTRQYLTRPPDSKQTKSLSNLCACFICDVQAQDLSTSLRIQAEQAKRKGGRKATEQLLGEEAQLLPKPKAAQASAARKAAAGRQKEKTTAQAAAEKKAVKEAAYAAQQRQPEARQLRSRGAIAPAPNLADEEYGRRGGRAKQTTGKLSASKLVTAAVRRTSMRMWAVTLTEKAALVAFEVAMQRLAQVPLHG
jgi:hypothetical protein